MLKECCGVEVAIEDDLFADGVGLVLEGSPEGDAVFADGLGASGARGEGGEEVEDVLGPPVEAGDRVEGVGVDAGVAAGVFGDDDEGGRVEKVAADGAAGNAG